MGFLRKLASSTVVEPLSTRGLAEIKFIRVFALFWPQNALTKNVRNHT